VGPTQPPIQWSLGMLSLGTKQLDHATDHSLPSSAKVSNALELCIHAHYMPHGVLLRHNENFLCLLCFTSKQMNFYRLLIYKLIYRNCNYFVRRKIQKLHLFNLSTSTLPISLRLILILSSLHLLYDANL